MISLLKCKIYIHFIRIIYSLVQNIYRYFAITKFYRFTNQISGFPASNILHLIMDQSFIFDLFFCVPSYLTNPSYACLMSIIESIHSTFFVSTREQYSYIETVVCHFSIEFRTNLQITLKLR